MAGDTDEVLQEEEEEEEEEEVFLSAIIIQCICLSSLPYPPLTSLLPPSLPPLPHLPPEQT